MKESTLVAKIKKALVDTYGENIVVYKIHGSNYQEAGIPDLLLCCRGKFIGLEVKTGEHGYKATPIQLWQIDRIKRAGGGSLVVESVEQSLKFVAEFVK